MPAIGDAGGVNMCRTDTLVRFFILRVNLETNVNGGGQECPPYTRPGGQECPPGTVIILRNDFCFPSVFGCVGAGRRIVCRPDIGWMRGMVDAFAKFRAEFVEPCLVVGDRQDAQHRCQPAYCGRSYSAAAAVGDRGLYNGQSGDRGERESYFPGFSGWGPSLDVGAWRGCGGD